MFEEYTEQYFLAQARALGDELGVDTRTGSVYMDMAAGHCLRAALFFANLSEVFNMIAMDTCYGDILDDKAAEWGLARHPSSAAVFFATFIGTQPEPGDRFFAVDSEHYFTVITEEDSGELLLEAQTEGTGANSLSAGTVLTPVDDIEGLQAAYLGEIYSRGVDEEEDDDFRNRLREKIAGPAENGNRQHYKTWCESVDGVGRARIIPLFAGENTVRAILYSPDGLPVSPAVVDAVQEYIDPITMGYEFTDSEGRTWVCGDGFGDGVANIGAHFLATAAEALPVTVSFDVVLTDGSSMEGCRLSAENAIGAYLCSLAMDSDEREDIVVRISTVGALISDLPEVLDYSGLALNGAAANITVGNAAVPVLEGVVVSAAS